MNRVLKNVKDAKKALVVLSNVGDAAMVPYADEIMLIQKHLNLAIKNLGGE